MHRAWLMAAVGIAALPLRLLAEETAAPPAGGPVTCGEFQGMDSSGQLAALSAIEPLGGEIDAQDIGASQDWAKAVGNACEGAPEKALEDAAQEALTAE